MIKPAPTAAAMEIVRERYADAKVVFLSGSVVRGEMTATSDLDLVVIYESMPQAYRESFVHRHWPVEAFVHDPQTLRYFFAEFDRPTGIPSLANMVADGIALPDVSEFATSMKELANSSLVAGPVLWGARDVDASRYKITDLLDDLRSPRSKDEARATATQLYQLAADHFFRSQQLWSAHGKSIPRRFAVAAPEIGRQFVAAFAALFEHGDCLQVIDFCEQVLAPAGGPLFAGYRIDAPSSWRARQPLDAKDAVRNFPNNAALVLIDLQLAVDHPSWGARNNPNAETNVARLLAAWRKLGLPLIHVRHDSIEPNSTYRPGQTGNNFKPEAQPLDGETVVAKRTNSAFIGTQLEVMLRNQGCTTLIVAGVSSSNSVDATVRMAGNLGFDTYLIEDATFTFDKKDWHGTLKTAAEVHAMSLANLNGEYCKVVTTDWVLNHSRSNHGQRSN